MVDITKLKDSEIPPALREREKFLETILAVAEEIGYGQKWRRGKTRMLLNALNERGIPYPDLRRVTLAEAMQYARPWETPIELRVFLKYHLRELWEASGSRRRVPQEIANNFVRQPLLDNTTDEDKYLPIASDNNFHRSVRKGTGEFINIFGWTVRRDQKGYFRAYRRIRGRLRSVYIGKDLLDAQAELQEKGFPYE